MTEKTEALFLAYYKDDLGALQFKNKLNLYRFNNQIDECARLIPKNNRVLEVGCGCGYVMAKLSELRPDLDLQGTDISPSSTWNMLDKLRLSVDDSTHSKFNADYFDAVISFGVMEHTQNDKMFLSELSRILKKGGLNLMYNLPNKYALNDFIARLLSKGGHKVRYTKGQIKTLFANNSFCDIQIKREFIIPAQVSLVSKIIATIFNKYYQSIHKLDLLLMRTPLALFSQTYTIQTIKRQEK